MSEMDLQKTNEDLSFIREEVKSVAPRLENIEKAHAALDAQEKANQKLVAELAQKAAKAEELEAKMNALEADLKRGGLNGEEKAAKKEELKSFELFLIKGADFSKTSPEAKYLRTDNNESGGYLAPTEYISEIIKNITEISPVRQLARVIPTSRKSITIPKETALASFSWLGEGESISSSAQTYGSEEIFANKGGIKVEISNEMLDDALFDMRSEISSMAAKLIAKGEGAAFISGSGVKQPEGLLTNSSVDYYASGSSSAIIADSLFAIQGQIPTGYNLSWMFNRKTLHQHIRTLKDDNGQYLLQLGIAGGVPNTVAGLPYALANDMPDVASGAYPVILGDFREAYVIVDNRQIRFKEDPFSSLGSDKVVFYVFKRTGGQVIKSEALKKLKIATS